MARSTHHHRQQNLARSDGESHSGHSARSGEGPTTADTSHVHTNTSSKPQPRKARTSNQRPPTHHTHTRTHTNTRGKHTRTTTNTDTRTHKTHTSTGTMHTRRATKTHNTGNPQPNPTETGNRTRGPQQGVAREHQPRTLSQEWRGATHHHHRTAARSGGEPHLVTPHKRADLSQEWRRTTPPGTTSGPQPGVAGSSTQHPQRGVARDHPPPPAAGPSHEGSGRAYKQLGQDWRGAAPPAPPPLPSQKWRKTHHRTQHSRRGQTGRKEPTGDAGEGRNLKGFWEAPCDRIGPG